MQDKGLCHKKKNVGDPCSFDEMCKQYAICSAEVGGSCICQQGFVPQQGGCGGREYSVSVRQITFDNDEDMMILMIVI